MGPIDAVITALEAEAKNPRRMRLRQQAMRRMTGCYRRNQPDMRDDAYLARGWPMGTGRVEVWKWRMSIW